MSSIASRFIEIRKIFGFNQKDFASLLGTGQSNISRIEKGEYPPSPAQIELLRVKLDVNAEWLQTGEGSMFVPEVIPRREVKMRRIPILGDIPAGSWEYWIDTYPTGAGDGYVDLSDIKGKNLFAVRVKGDSMEPRFHTGDVLICDPHKVFDGGIAVVRHQGGYKVRAVRKMDNKYRLIPLNNSYPEEDINPDEETAFYVPVKVLSMRDV